MEINLPIIIQTRLIKYRKMIAVNINRPVSVPGKIYSSLTLFFTHRHLWLSVKSCLEIVFRIWDGCKTCWWRLRPRRSAPVNILANSKTVNVSFIFKQLLSVVIILSVIPSYAGTAYYVAVTGKANNYGSISSPWDLQTALNQPSVVHPGDTIYITAGIYPGVFTSNLTGAVSKPIIIKNAPGQRVIINGSLAGKVEKNLAAFTIKGAYAWYMGLEITNSDTARVITIAGSNPRERRGGGVDVYGPGVKVINFIIYDTGGGFGAWTPAINSEYYGNLIFNNGWYAPDRGHGHGVYTQNNTGTKSFIDNIILNNFGNGWQIYGSSKSKLKNFYLEGNVVFNDRWLIGGDAPLQNIELNTNFAYNDRPQFGYISQQNDSLRLRNNFFPGGISVYCWKNVMATGNTIFAGSSLGSPVSMIFAGPPDLSAFNFNANTYYWARSSQSQGPLKFSWINNTLASNNAGRTGLFYLKDWRRKGQDRHSTLKLLPLKNASHLKIQGNNIFIRKNKYDSNRATIVVYNWELAKNVAVKVNGILFAGDEYELHNAENYFGDIIHGKYNGGNLIIPMTGHSVAKPLGYDRELAPGNFPEFGTFILIKSRG